LYRALQEALTNIVRHAQAKNVWVALQVNQNETTLSIEDDGKGFDLQKVMNGVSPRMGIGLLGIQERLEQIDGWLEIDSNPGKGTMILAHIPNRGD